MDKEKKRVLLVDDDVDLQKMLRLRIEAEGYEFMSAHDGREMLNLIKTEKPDAILLDILLPNMDGYTALREMRKVEEFKDIPVIVLSAKERKKIGDLFALENVSFFLEKPYDTNDLFKKLRSIMR